MSSEKHLSRAEAAEACNVSTHTIRRAEKAGKFPGLFRNDKDHVRIPLSDLVRSGHLPIPQIGDTDLQLVESDSSAPEAISGGTASVEAEARIDALEALLARAEAEVDFLRKMVAGQLKAVA